MVMTASHVLTAICDSDKEGNWHFKPGVSCWIDFGEEYGDSPAAEFDLTEVISCSMEGCPALLRVASQSKQGGSLPAPLVLASKPPGSLSRRRLYIVGYPAYDMRNPAELMDLVFGKVYNVKRLQPGVLLEMNKASNEFVFDCFTSGGTGGAPVIDLATNQVLGMHYGGKFDSEEERKFAFAWTLWPLRNVEAYLGLNWGE
jgi:hypothetical protein